MPGLRILLVSLNDAWQKVGEWTHQSCLRVPTNEEKIGTRTPRHACSEPMVTGVAPAGGF